MKSRIAFLFVVAAFLNPVAVFALDGKDIVCKDWAMNQAKDHAVAVENGTGEYVNGVFVKKVQTAGSGH